MRVLHLDSGREMRGGQVQVLHLISGAPEDHALLARPGSPLLATALARGVEAHPFSLAALARLANEADLVHAHDARSHTWAIALSRKPLVVSRRVAFSPGSSLLSRWKYGKARLYIAISEFVKRGLIGVGVPESRIRVVYDGVAIPATAASGDRIVALHSEDPMKGSDLLRRAEESGGFEVVYSKDLQADLPAAGLFVYLTRSEGLGSAALLAMAYGVPVVASRTGGLPEIVEDGVTGVLTDNEPGAIREAVNRAWAIRKQLGAAARERVIARFSAARMAEETHRVYSEMVC